MKLDIKLMIYYSGTAVGYTASVFIAKKLKIKMQFTMSACIMIVAAGKTLLEYFYLSCLF